MAGKEGLVIPWPLFAPAYPGEPFFDQASRYLDVLLRSDIHLTNAPIMGWNRLAPLARSTGMLLCAAGLTIVEMESCLTEPSVWLPHFLPLVKKHRELKNAYKDFKAYSELSKPERDTRSDLLKSKLELFRHSPPMRAMFGTTKPGISWQEVVDKRQCVLIDLSDISTRDQKLFCLLWIFQSLLSFLKRRKPGRHLPLSLVIDELSFLTSTAGVNPDILTSDLDELVNRLARNSSCFVTLATQDLSQFNLPLQHMLLSAGNLIIGGTSDPQTAEALTKRFIPLSLSEVKKSELVSIGGLHSFPGHFDFSPIFRTTEYTLEEQLYRYSRMFLELPAFHFFLAQAEREGTLPTKLVPFSIENRDANRYPNLSLVETALTCLSRRDGLAIAELLAEIPARTRNLAANKGDKAAKPAAKSSALPPESATPEPPKGRFGKRL
jgi:hypothetical protein